MTQMSFTAQELLSMAFLQHESDLYGIPIPSPDRIMNVIHETVDSMVTNKLATIDLDGIISLNPAYQKLTSWICRCQKCLIINRQSAKLAPQHLVFWLYNDQYKMAELIGERYCFFDVDTLMINGLLNQASQMPSLETESSRVTIPFYQLMQAKNFCANRKNDDALRLLRQNNVPEPLLHLIINGIYQSTDYLNIIYWDNAKTQPEQKLTALFDAHQLYSLEETVINLRTCLSFLPCSSDALQQQINEIRQSFIDEEVSL